MTTLTSSPGGSTSWARARAPFDRIAGVLRAVPVVAALAYGVTRPDALIGLGVVFALVVPFERLFPRHRQRLRRPQLGTDIAHALFAGPLAAVGLAVGLTISLVSLVWLPALALRPLVLALPSGARAVAGFFLLDALGYWIHRFSHQVPVMWRFHAVHHSTMHLDWVSGFRVHPLDGALLTPIAVFLIVAGFGLELTGAGLAVQIAFGIFAHANVRWRLRPLQRIVLTPEFHHWHHSNEPVAHNRNFGGILPLWDLLMGTYFVPADRRPSVYGISEPMPAGLVGQLLHPLRGLPTVVRRLRKPRGAMGAFRTGLVLFLRQLARAARRPSFNDTQRAEIAARAAVRSSPMGTPVGNAPASSVAPVPIRESSSPSGPVALWQSFSSPVIGGVAIADVALVIGMWMAGVLGHAVGTRDAAEPIAPLDAVTATLSLAAALVLIGRRWRPLTMLCALIIVAVAANAVRPPGLHPIQFALVVAALCFAVGSWSSRVRSACGVLAVSLLVAVAGSASDGTAWWAALTLGLAVIALPAIAGYAARTRRQYVGEIERRLVLAESERDERARQAVRNERTHIARELHDLVAHHVSLIGVQAGAARLELAAGGTESPQVVRALNRIEENSRRAVQEMRVLLDALRPVAGVDGEAEHASAAAAPQPGPDDVPALADRLRAAGIEVALTGSGIDTPLPSGISLTAYRIIEEALTNVTRHSYARSVRVDLSVGPHDVRVRVEDRGPARGPATAADDGRVRRGLVGMAERIELYGGRLAVGPTASGGFTVDAWLPLVSSPLAGTS